MVEKAMTLFPGAEITAIRESEATAAPDGNDEDDDVKLTDQRNG